MSNFIQAPVFNGTIQLDGQMPVEFSSNDIAVPNQFPVNSGLNVSNTTVFLINVSVSGSLGSTSLTIGGTGVTGIVSGMGIELSTSQTASTNENQTFVGPTATSAIPKGAVVTHVTSPTVITISSPLTSALSHVSVGFFYQNTPCNFPSSNAEPSARAGAARATFPQVPSISLAYLPRYVGPQ